MLLLKNKQVNKQNFCEHFSWGSLCLSFFKRSGSYSGGSWEAVQPSPPQPSPPRCSTAPSSLAQANRHFLQILLSLFVSRHNYPFHVLLSLSFLGAYLQLASSNITWHPSSFSVSVFIELPRTEAQPSRKRKLPALLWHPPGLQPWCGSVDVCF